MSKKTKKICKIAIEGILVLLIAAWIVWGNTALEMNSYTLTSDALPEAFDGFRIAQVSDLHNAEMGKENETLLAMLREANPDVIVITGDMIDAFQTKIDIALRFAEQALTIAPCYYVTGNHEAGAKGFGSFKRGLIELGVTVLENAKVTIELGGETITLAGVNDPSFGASGSDGESGMDAVLTDLIGEEDGFVVLLSHRPELFQSYVKNEIDLVFSGHAHGGQFRLPLIGGLIAPDQGLFPKYDAGLYSEGSTTMAVSKGIGNSIIPFRVNNRPEVILIELHSEKKPA